VLLNLPNANCDSLEVGYCTDYCIYKEFTQNICFYFYHFEHNCSLLWNDTVQ